MFLKNETISQVKACAYCYMMCRHYCTISSVIRANYLTPRGKALLIIEALNGRLRLDEISELIYLCTNCGRCYVACETKISNPPRIFEEIREILVSKGLVPEWISKVIDRMVNTPRRDALRDLVSSRNLLAKDSKVIYYAGADIRENYPEIGLISVELLEKLGLNVRILEEEPHDGGLYYLLGYRKYAYEAALKIMEKLKDAHARKLIVGDPLSYVFFKKHCPEMGVQFNGIEVLHIVQLLSSRIAGKGKLNATAIIHDPCFLGRRGDGLYDEFRKVLNGIVGLVTKEMYFSKEHALCCGGLLRPLKPELAERIAAKFTAFVEPMEADFLVTACPRCKQSFESVGIRALDVIEILNDAYLR